MPRLAYLDCFSGVSGDMLLGALADAGLALEDLRPELARVPVSGYEIRAERVKRAGIAATQVTIAVEGRPAPRTLSDVLAIIENSSLPESDRRQAAAVFRRLAEAEARVHGETVESVHLHDVGAVDAIVDVIGAVAGFRLLGVDALFCSALPLGDGEAAGPHGALPVPAPATLELLAGARAPVRPSPAAGELVTPTGAAILTTLASFRQPEMTIERTGYGAGARDPAHRPNVLRLWIGEGGPAAATRPMTVLETNIDDMPGEMLAYACERLLEEGAADAWLTPVQMKKGRPGFVLSVICAPEQADALARLVLRETSTLGVRARPVERWEAEREVLEFESSLGPAAAKIKRLPGEAPRAAPEYESCKRLAQQTGLPLAEVYRTVQAEAEARVGGGAENREPRT